MQYFLHIPRVAEAFRYAVLAHGNQNYGELPYFTHLLHVAEVLPEPSENELVAAMLHDIVEDTRYSINDVRENFGDPVAEIVQVLTKDWRLTYAQNIGRIVYSGNHSAVKVKWADNLANMQQSKAHMSGERRTRLTDQYAKSFSRLSKALGI